MTTWSDRVRQAYAAALGDLAGTDEGFGPVAVDVPADRWVEALTLARDGLGCTFFDWLSAVDEVAVGSPGDQLAEDGFRVVCHLADHAPGRVDHLLVRTLIPREAPLLASATGVFAGAHWHERETHEMFGIDFTVDGEALELEPLLLPDEFEGHPLRKEFVLASRVAKPWPGAKEPGESDAGQAHAAPAGRARRRARAPGVPDPGEWGPRDA